MKHLKTFIILVIVVMFFVFLFFHAAPIVENMDTAQAEAQAEAQAQADAQKVKTDKTNASSSTATTAPASTKSEPVSAFDGQGTYSTVNGNTETKVGKFDVKLDESPGLESQMKSITDQLGEILSLSKKSSTTQPTTTTTTQPTTTTTQPTTTTSTSTQTIPPTNTYYTSDGKETCIVNGNTITCTNADTKVTTTYTSTSTSNKITDKIFNDLNGGVAKFFSDGIHFFIEVAPSNGSIYLLSATPPAIPPSSSSLYPWATSPSSMTSYPWPSSTQMKATTGGIPSSMIPPGTEDLYILKSEVVPPVCPKCPDVTMSSSSDKEQCPPCPACARCPEPSFDCKKVPNYQSMDPNMLPTPVLNDFSNFGM
jgi:hypothetical protein